MASLASSRAPDRTDHSPAVRFLLGGVATSMACVFSNPPEVVKSRMQMQGELARSSASALRPYHNVFQAFWEILRTEGLHGIQRGLGAGIAYQFTMNGTRLGCYEPLQRVFGAEAGRADYMLRSVAAGAVCGALGAFVGSPFFLVKARLQIQAKDAAHAVGFQHKYKGVLDGLTHIFRHEGGLAGLWKGVDGAIPRVMVGSAAQLSTYSQCKHSLVAWLHCSPDAVSTHLAASMLASLAVTTAMNPFDVVSTRLYNQRGYELYSGPVDCATKILSTEGFAGLYKGFTAHYFRLGPHTVLTFIFWEQLKQLAGHNS